MSDGLTRLSVNMNEGTRDALRSLTSEAGTSHTETVRRAVSVLKFIEDERRQGNKVLIAEPGGGLREVIFL